VTGTRTAAPLRGLPVSLTMYTFVDPTRQVISNGVVLANQRSLPTYVWVPDTPGKFPLVVFAAGYDVGPPTYARFCSTLASSGYVVAAPSFPLEDPSRGFGLNRSDLPNEATDVSFVITSMLQGPVADRIVRDQIAVVGHSDGADVALMVGYQQGKADPRVDAVVADAPDPMSGSVTPGGAPLLLMQGNADPVVPYSSSQTVFSQVTAPRYYLTLLGAGHLPPIQGATPWTPVVDSSVAEFLDAAVAHRGRGLAALPGELGALPLSSLQVAP
jgi:dienelactone hydrolase